MESTENPVDENESVISNLVDLIFLNARDYQFLVAKDNYEKLMKLKDDCPDETWNRIVHPHQDALSRIVAKVKDVEVALHSCSMDQEREWTFASDHFGVVTHYHKRSDGLLTVHLEGKVDDLPFFEQLAVINEVDLFKEWVPFCSSSSLVKRVGNAELVAHFCLSFPFFSRECAVLCYGADCLYEHGCILILGESVDNPCSVFADFVHETDIHIPWIGGGNSFFSSCHDKMILKDIKAMFKVDAPSSAKVVI